MEYGLIIYTKTDNLGDDIQSYATAKYLPRIDYYIDRESMHTFYPNSQRQVAVILSGWYLYEHLHWPPSPFICPLIISTHFDTYYSRAWGQPLENNLVLEEYGASWLNRYGPVGARDNYTLELLRRFNIKSYFSGCITLTLKPFANVENHNKIVAVDISKELQDYIALQAGETPIFKTHKLALSEYGMERRFMLVEEYLKLYQGAKLVVTSRLHAALPAIALGTPVLFVKDTRFFNRTQTYLQRMNAAFEWEIINGIYSYNFRAPLMNPVSCHDIQSAVSERCTDFVSNMGDQDGDVISSEIIMRDMGMRIEHAKALIQRNYDTYGRSQ